jgi:PAS domain S-box-containing protein
MTKVILLVLTDLVVGLTLVTLIGWIVGSIPLDSLIILLIMVGVFGGGMWLAHRGYWRVVAHLPSGLIFLIAVYGNYIGGIGAPAMLLYALAITLAALLQSNIAQWIMLALSLVAYLALGIGHASGYIQQVRFAETAFVNRAMIVSGTLISITLLLWFLVRQFKRALQESRAHADTVSRFRTLAENATDAIVMMDLEGTVTYVNSAFCDFLRCDLEEVIGQTLSIFAEETERFKALVVQALTDGGEGEMRFRRKDDTYFDASLTIFALRGVHEEATGIAAIIHDITDRKQAEEAQRHLQQEVIEAQQQTLKELSTPLIPMMDVPGRGAVIAMPLVGSIDTLRARDIMRALLAGIREHNAHVVIVDITGVPIVDTGVAGHLNKAVQAARLKGAHVIITGISDAVAEAIVDLGIDWHDIETLRDLQTGLQAALIRMQQ